MAVDVSSAMVKAVDNPRHGGYTRAMRTILLLAAVAVSARAQDVAPEQAQLYFAGGRLLAVYASHIELYRYGNVLPAVSRPEHEARPLVPGVSVKGFPAFLDKRGRTVDIRPERRSFGELSPPPERASGSPFVSVCALDPNEFCGLIGLDGREQAVLRSEEEPGVRREPVGSSPDGTEALFALTKSRAGGGREVVGYRLWRRRKSEKAPREERLPPDDPQVRVMLDAYQGPLLDDPDRHLPFGEDRPLRRRR
jgi:hypothetical protein